jgi:cleavage and polyadenylation specificity factor subunit 2
MVEGKIAFQMGSTVPTLERAELVLPRKEEEVEVKAEPLDVTTEVVVPVKEDNAQPEGDSKMDVETSEAQPESTEIGVDKVETETSDPIEISEEPTPAPKRQRVRPPTSRPTLSLPSSLFIGDLRLTVLRTRLQALTPPMPAEFAGSGVLVCGPGVLALANQGEKGNVVKAGSIVAVRKGDQGVEIEGSVGSVYDLVKKEVYGSFAQVSAA